MFCSKFPKISSKIRIVEIDKELYETPVYHYMKRKDLKDEKINLLARIKSKEKVSDETGKFVSP